MAILRSKTDRFLYNERGPDDPELKAALAEQYIMLVNSVRDGPGNITNRQRGPTVISKDSPSPDNLVNLADWKKIYGDRQRRWEEWLEVNDADDRDTLKWCPPAPEWKTAMGW